MILSMVLCGALAAAQSIPLSPTEGTHVYQWPAGWHLPGVSDAQVAALEADIQGRHHPFYVVLMSGESLPGTGDGQARLQATTDALMTAWSEQGTDLSRAVVFSVAWGADCDKAPSARRPGTVCQYFLNAGPELIHGPAQFLPSRDHAPHTNLFRSAVATTPQAPTAGILSLVESVDTLLWQRTNPETLLRSARATLRQALAYRRELLPHVLREDQVIAGADLEQAEALLAQGTLEEVRLRGAELVTENEVLAARIAQYEAARQDLDLQALQLRRAVEAGLLDPDTCTPLLDAVRAAQEAGPSLAAIERAAEQLAPTVTTLEVEQAAAQRAMRRQQRTQLVGLGVLLLLALSGVVRLAQQREQALRLRHRYAEARERLGERLDRALGRYTQLSLEEVPLLTEATGATHRELRAIQAELDRIYAALSGLEAHLCRQDAHIRRAGPLAMPPVQEALDALQEPLPAPTRALPKAHLAALESDLQAIQVRQARLQAAAALRLQPADTLLDGTVLSGLQQRALRRGIPLAWLYDHPLRRDPNLLQLDALRRDDPLAYMNALEAHRAQEADIVERVGALEAALDALDRVRVAEDMLTLPEDMVISPDDAPHPLAQRAQHTEAEARRMLIAAALQRDAQPVLRALHAAHAAWQACRDRLTELDLAREAAASLWSLRATLDAATQRLHAETDACTQAEATFQQAPQGRALLDAARTALDAAAHCIPQAEARLEAHRLLEAYRLVQHACQHTDTAQQQLCAFQALLSNLEAQRAAYAEKHAALPETHARLAASLKIVSRTILPAPPAEVLALPADYAAASARLDALVAAWEADLEAARRRDAAPPPELPFWTEVRAHLRQARSHQHSHSGRSHTTFSVGITSHSSSHSSSGGGSSFGSGGSSSGGGGSFGSSGRSSGGGGGW